MGWKLEKFGNHMLKFWSERLTTDRSVFPDTLAVYYKYFHVCREVKLIAKGLLTIHSEEFVQSYWPVRTHMKIPVVSKCRELQSAIRLV